jgi:hypothetical protein
VEGTTTPELLAPAREFYALAHQLDDIRPPEHFLKKVGAVAHPPNVGRHAT